MKKQELSDALFQWVLPCIGLLVILVSRLTLGGQFVGHDYQYFFDQLLAGSLHFQEQGLTPFRWSAHLHGGMPVYGNPQGMYYSLQQLLALFVHPWIAVLSAICVYILVGWYGWFLLGRDVLKLDSSWSHALAATVSAHGFLLMHLFAGHLTFATFPLLGFLAWCVFRPFEKGFGIVREAALFALLVGLILHAGGYLVLLFFLLGCCASLPVQFLLFRKERGYASRMIGRLSLFFCVSLLLTASKLVAVTSLMEHLPRITPFLPLSTTLPSLHFAFKALLEIPQLATESIVWNFHEQSMLLSPVVPFGLCLVPFLWVRIAGALRGIFLFAWFCVVSWFFLELTMGRAWIVSLLEPLPVFRSLRVSLRFLYLLSLLVTAASFHALGTAMKLVMPRLSQTFASCSTIIALLVLLFGYSPHVLSNVTLATDLHLFTSNTQLPPASVIARESHVQEGISGLSFPVEPLHKRLRSKTSYLSNLNDGPMIDVRDDSFNLLNPACLQYPRENACTPGDRIQAIDAQNFAAFLEGKRTFWYVSRMQRVADGISVLVLAFCILVCLQWAISAIRSNKTGF